MNPADMFFQSAMGPNAVDVYGPAGNTLDVNADGTSMNSNSSVASNGGAPLKWYQRPDVHAAALFVLGVLGVRAHMNA